MQHCHYQAIWFDLDGTLFDTAGDIINAVQKTLADFDRPPADPAALKRRINYGARNLIADAFDCRADKTRTDKLMETYAHHYSQALTRETTWFAGMEDVIHEIEKHHIPWGIITNKAEQFTIPIAKALGLSERVAALVLGDTTNESKPSAKPLLYACTIAGCEARKCLFVGDNSTDIIAGKAADMTTVACAYGYTPHGEHVERWGADYVIEHPSELLSIIWR